MCAKIKIIAFFDEKRHIAKKNYAKEWKKKYKNKM